MTDHFEVMPDYLAALELELRRRAVHVTVEARPPVRWRRMALVTAVAVLALVPLLLLAETVRNDVPAYGRPAILAAPPGPIPPRVANGLVLHYAAGPKTELKRARRFHAAGAQVYLLDGDGVWCLSAPDPVSGDPSAESGVICTDTREFFRVGIQLVIKDRYIAVIPQGVKDPTVFHADGTSNSVHPNALGVVSVVPIAQGDRFVLHGIDGQRRYLRAR